MAETGLTRWFKERWVDLSRPKPGGGFEPCGRPDAATGKYPKCVPASRAARMTPAEIESAIRRKRRAESTQRREGKKPIMVPTIKKAGEPMGVPANMELYNQVKAEAKAKFDVYPSAYANGWLVQEYKRRGGTYKKLQKADDQHVVKSDPGVEDVHVPSIMDRQRKLKKRRMQMDMALRKGDYPGHPFRGNQWTGGLGGRGRVSLAGMAAKPKSSPQLPDNPNIPTRKLTEKQKDAEYDKLTTAQKNKYDSAPETYTHDQAMAVARGEIKRMDYDAVSKKSAKPGTEFGDEMLAKKGMAEATPARLKALHEEHPGAYIPPAWSDVVVVANPKGAGLLAMGKDSKGTTQYVYSAEHTKNQAAKKFARVQDLHRDVSKLDMKVAQDAKSDPAAAAALLIRKTGMRPGSTKETKAADQAYGATTLEARHVKVANGKVYFDFIGKKGVRIRLSSSDPDLVATITRAKAGKKPNERLFDISDSATNTYLKGRMGSQYTAKDLRTYKATSMALAEVAKRRPPKTAAELKQAKNEIAKIVSGQLGNKPNEALKSYINPMVFANWESGIA